MKRLILVALGLVVVSAVGLSVVRWVIPKTRQRQVTSPNDDADIIGDFGGGAPVLSEAGMP